MEHMSDAEKKQLQELQAKYKRVQRAESEFLKEADSRKEELMSRWGVQDRLDKAAMQIGADADSLYEWIISEPLIEQYHQTHDDKSSAEMSISLQGNENPNIENE